MKYRPRPKPRAIVHRVDHPMNYSPRFRPWAIAPKADRFDCRPARYDIDVLLPTRISKGLFSLIAMINKFW